MGYGSYSLEAHEAIARARVDLPREKVFSQSACHALMNPHGVVAREARDSDVHARSLGVVFALDVTGSMGEIPERLARKELPQFMRTLGRFGVSDPQVLFLAVGDATSDKAPLQVGQFESAAREIDQWLTWTFLEAGGGGQGAESYELAMYFAARHTDMDCFRKRQKRGYFFMTGDERPYPAVSRHQVERLLGHRLDEDLPVARVVAELQRTFEPFFLIPDPRRRAACERVWRDLLGDRVVLLEDPGDTCPVSAGLLGLCEGTVADLDAFAAQLEAEGTDRRRIGSVVRALTPFAATLSRDGTPQPALDAPTLPRGEGPRGMRRPG